MTPGEKAQHRSRMLAHMETQKRALEAPPVCLLCGDYGRCAPAQTSPRIAEPEDTRLRPLRAIAGVCGALFVMAGPPAVLLFWGVVAGIVR
jgi:hypothetical protein